MQKRKTFRPWQPQQATLLPPSPREWLSEDHQVYWPRPLAWCKSRGPIALD
ncbi:hypothetical protein H8F24_14840 [Synechococcus sp. CBW1002]|jgi:hypothetical protein|uniref:hypothetical protein n=1 Tax=unclassified Synechococcus TaxID=2626047 RepID=UPI0018CCF2E0|nr:MULTISPECIES: hypothetical protein [unclassified Synechococcus]QPN59299.1 hypothetical protein H8F24_14840 [Synechococcus sp. CBW1002]QPN67152.1 hypothetical protein H8F26_02460 [Synechococcus sp. CBW1006]